jgi:hypothetical protein
VLNAFILSLVLQGTPEHAPYQVPVSATKPRYIEALEENTQLVYPAIAVLVLLLIALGVISAWRSEDMDGIQKAEVKREIIRELRREIHGITVDRLAKLVKMPSFKVAKLLGEMEAQGIAESRTDTRRLTTWRLKGLTT